MRHSLPAMDDDIFEFESGTSDPESQTEAVELRHLATVEDWARRHGSDEVRLLHEDPDNGSVVLEIWGKELQVYFPQDDGSSFFVTTDDEDARLHSLLAELNDMRRLRTLPDFLTAASRLNGTHASNTAACLESQPIELRRIVRNDSIDSQEALAPESANAAAVEVLDFHGLSRRQETIVLRISASSQLEPSVVELLLLHLEWDHELLLRRLLDGEHKKLLVAAGAATCADESTATASARTAMQRSQLCSACFASDAVSCLPCGHGLCIEDWPSFLKCNLDSGTVSGENCLRLKCPGERCPLLVPSRVFREFLSPADFDRYRRLQVLSFVDESRKMAWCPADACELCVAWRDETTRSASSSSSSTAGAAGAAGATRRRRQSTVRCDCGHSFCFDCRLVAHAPAQCSSARAWLAKAEETKGLSQCKTVEGDNKPCPNPECGVLAHKDSGCHYLSCSRCKEKWCWQCGDWGGGPSGRPEPHHVYDCNSAVNKEWYKLASAVDVFNNDGKYWYYLERYKNHLSSLTFAERLRKAVEVMVAEIQDDVRFRIQDIRLVRDAAELLIESRLVLAWTYVWAFFEHNEAQLRLFEFVQKDLETKTEQLSSMIENRPAAEALDERTKLIDYISALRGYLENIKAYTVTDPAAARNWGAAVAEALQGTGPSRSSKPSKLRRLA